LISLVSSSYLAWISLSLSSKISMLVYAVLTELLRCATNLLRSSIVLLWEISLSRNPSFNL
jgi:hypothetical protein